MKNKFWKLIKDSEPQWQVKQTSQWGQEAPTEG